MSLDLSKYEGHTPGEWSVEPHGKTTALYSGRNELIGGFHVHGLRLMNLDDGDKNFEANCKLIADAPQLLAELREAREENERLKDAIELLRMFVGYAKEDSEFIRILKRKSNDLLTTTRTITRKDA